MRRLTAWVGGALGGITAYRWLRRRPQAEPEPSPEPESVETDERAEELRAKLAETRAGETVPEEQLSEPPPAEEGGGEPESPEERRQRVHDEARAALDEMRPDGGS